MRGRVSRYRVRLNRKPRQRLEALVRRRTPQHYMVMRAKIVLASADGLSIGRICGVLSLDHQVVRRWIKRYMGLGYDGLKDEKRSGRPPAIGPTVWQKITTIVVQPPKKFGVPLARWSIREMCAFLRERFGWNVSRASISRPAHFRSRRFRGRMEALCPRLPSLPIRCLRCGTLACRGWTPSAT